MAYGRGAAAVRALEEVSLGIRQGEFIAVVGPSGCGKSSLMRLISGLHPPASGSLTVEGKRVTGPLKSVGMAFQNSNLLPWRTALENVLLPLEIVEPYRRDFSKQKYAETSASRR
jgi:NitT/TauT family transport system ATP-binding protein